MDRWFLIHHRKKLSTTSSLKLIHVPGIQVITQPSSTLLYREQKVRKWQNTNFKTEENRTAIFETNEDILWEIEGILVDRGAVNTAVRIRSRLGQPCWVINTLRPLLIKGFFQSLTIIIFIANWGLPYKSLHRVYKHEMHFTVACIISKIEIINWCLLYFFLFMQSWFQFIYSSW